MASVTNFLIELRRRNVFKVGVAYAIVSWLLLQIADTIFLALHLPPWSITLVTVLVIIGFPLVLIIAWAHGVTSDESVSVSVTIAESDNKSVDQQRVANNGQVPSNNNSLPAVQKDGSGKFSIVVLPFEVISKDAEDESLADGITTEIINNLGRIDIFEVASLHSAFIYKGQHKDAREVGQELGVKFVLEGSLRKSGSRVRVAVALIYAHSNRQVWAESYDRELVDPLELEDQLGRIITDTLGSVLWRASMDETNRMPSKLIDVSSFIDRANLIFVNYSQRSFEEGKKLINSFNEENMENGHGYAMLAFISAHEMINFWTESPKEARNRSLEAADRAIELDGGDVWVLGLTSEALVWLGETQRAVAMIERAVASAPDNLIDHTRARYGHALLHLDRGEEGLAQIECAIEASPAEHYTPPWHYLFLCWAYTHLKRYEEATVNGRKAMALHHANCLCVVTYTNTLAEIGHLDEAQVSLADLKRISPRLTIEHLEWVYQMAFEKKEIAERYLCGLRKLDWS